MDTTATLRMLTMRMMMTEETSPHPLLLRPPVPTPLVAAPKVIIVDKEDPMEMVPKQEAPEAHDVILTDAKPKPSQPWLYTVLMRDYVESPSRMMDDLHELDDLTEADYDVDEWYPKDGSHDRDWVIESNLKFRIKNKSLGVI
jgi:hypothetical protein